MYKSLSRFSSYGLRFTNQSNFRRWQTSGALKRDLRPIHEHKPIPDGMEVLDGMTVDNLHESLVFSSTKILEVLQSKHATMDGRSSRPIVYVNEDNTVFEAIKAMTEAKIGAVLVRPKGSDEDFVGILTERDYMNKVALNGLDSRHTPVHRIMTRNPITVRTDETCLTGLKRMTKGRFRHIPVTQSGKIIGILSLGDLVKSVLSSFKDSVDYLSEYIGGTGVAGADETFIKSK